MFSYVIFSLNESKPQQSIRCSIDRSSWPSHKMHDPIIWLEQGYKQCLDIMSVTLSALYQGVLLFIALVPKFYTQILFYSLFFLHLILLVIKWWLQLITSPLSIIIFELLKFWFSFYSNVLLICYLLLISSSDWISTHHTKLHISLLTNIF